ncbi:MAG: winged helix-turn-helix transcriptional regulator [Kofleriaceae bacterium]|nr:winged helix-turn-helix transcriptional regulator [Kofleriaceae bacterium]
MHEYEGVKRVSLDEAFNPELFRALAEPTRIQILAVLMRAGGEAKVSDIASHLPVDTSVVSRHLRELVQAGVLEVERRGRERWYRLRYDSMIHHFSELVRQLKALRDGKACC